MQFYICELYLVYRRNQFDSLIVHDQVIKRGVLAELHAHARERSPIAKKIWLPVHPCGLYVHTPSRPFPRPHHTGETNVKCYTCQLVW